MHSIRRGVADRATARSTKPGAIPSRACRRICEQWSFNSLSSLHSEIINLQSAIPLPPPPPLRRSRRLQPLQLRRELRADTAACFRRRHRRTRGSAPADPQEALAVMANTPSPLAASPRLRQHTAVVLSRRSPTGEGGSSRTCLQSHFAAPKEDPVATLPHAVCAIRT